MGKKSNTVVPEILPLTQQQSSDTDYSVQLKKMSGSV